MTYAELVAAVQDYLETREATFVAAIPTFVRQAEERILRAVVIPELRKNATTSLVAGTEYLARPTDMLSVFSLAVINAAGVYTYLLNKDVNFLREAYPDPTETGNPKYYAQFNGDTAANTTTGNFLIAPSPAADHQVQLHYYFDPPSIVDSDTSWLGENAETVLLYATLVEAYRYLKGDPDMMATYDARYTAAINDLETIGVRMRGDAYRDKMFAS